MTTTETAIIEALKSDGLIPKQVIVDVNRGLFLECNDFFNPRIKLHKRLDVHSFIMMTLKIVIPYIKTSHNYPLYMAYVLGNRNEE